MYILLAIFTVLMTLCIYRSVIASDRDWDKWFYASVVMAVADIAVIVATAILYTNGELTGPLVPLYDVIASLHIPTMLGNLVMAVIGFFSDDTVVGAVEILCVVICILALAGCIVASRIAIKKQSKEGQ